MGTPGFLSLSFSPCLLAAIKWAGSLPCAFFYDVLAYHHKFKSSRAKIMDWNLWNQSQNKPFLLLSWLSQVFVTVMESWLTHNRRRILGSIREFPSWTFLGTSVLCKLVNLFFYICKCKLTVIYMFDFHWDEFLCNSYSYFWKTWLNVRGSGNNLVKIPSFL
jgi:hypothetical protein